MKSMRTKIAAIAVGGMGLLLPLAGAAPALAGGAPTDDPSETQPIEGNWFGPGMSMEPGESMRIAVSGNAEAPKFSGKAATAPCIEPGQCIEAEIHKVIGEGTSEDPNVVLVEVTNGYEEDFNGRAFMANFIA